MPKGLRLPLLLLGCGALIAASLTTELWLPLITSQDTDSSRHDSTDPLAGEITSDVGEPVADNHSPLHADDTSLRQDDTDSEYEAALRAKREADEKARLKAEADKRAGTSGKAANGKAGDGGAKSEKEAGTEEEVEEEELPIETVEGQQINPNLGGHLQVADNARIKGWVNDKFEPESTIMVEVHIDDELRYEVRADRRQDHKKLGVIWHFEIKEPRELQDAEKHVIRALAYRTDQHGKTELRGSPRAKVVGSYPRGKLEEASPEEGIAGYAWDPDDKDTPCAIVVRIDGEVVAESKADIVNEELKTRRIAPTATCAFKVDWPTALDDGLDHTVQVFAVNASDGTEHELDGSPRVVNARSGLANEAPFGRFDICNKVVLAGWAYDLDADTGTIDVEIWIDEELFAQVPANSKRDTLRNSKVTPDPYHGFVTTTPTQLLDGKTHTIRVFALNYPSGVKVEVDGSPKQYRMEDNTVPMGGFWRADEKMLRGWAADPDHNSDPCEIEIYIDGELWKRTVADRREDWLIGTGFAPNAEHGFAITPPDFALDGQPHDVQILAINFPEGPPRNLGTRTIGLNSTYPGFWTSDKLLDTRVSKGLYVSGVSPWYDAYHKDVKKGDVLLEYDGIEAGTQEVKDDDGKVTTEGTMSVHFRSWLNENKKKNDIVKFKFWRDGETYEVDVKMGELKGK